MQLNKLSVLTKAPTVLEDPFAYILDCARGKRVLNVGAAGGVETYLPRNRDMWLHHLLSEVAAEITGIDIDADSVAYAAEYGVNLVLANCETCSLKQHFDVVVMSDVIEHLDGPVTAIANLGKHLVPGGCLVITTPNPTHISLVLRAWAGRNVKVYYDHVCEFLPEHFQAIGARARLELSEVAFFTQIDKRTAGNYLKSHVARILGRWAPRSNASLLIVLRKTGNA